jgi:DNA recombination protein RmuC
MLPPILSDLILVLLLLVSIALCISLYRRSSSANELGRVDIRLEELVKRLAQHEDRLTELKLAQQDTSAKTREYIFTSFSEFRTEIRTIFSKHNTNFEKRQGEVYKGISESLQSGITNLQKQIGDYLNRYSEDLGLRMDSLTKKTDERLQQISGQVEKRLTEGFEKTTATFADIVKRLALIDEAQKKITELSTNVVSLQEILADKRSRGAFGEVQLNALIANVMPEHSYKLQYTLPNKCIADCALFLPEPSGTIIVDSKFPLESYRRMTDITISDADRKTAERQFKQDIGKHIQDISSKYIIPGTTSDGAIMFIPAEAVFAEIQAHYPDLVDKAHAARVWIVSPTTLWAIINTARSVLKDAATREQVHIIQEHLGMLSTDFGRFQKRMDDLEKHISMAHKDVEDVNRSAKKITSRFEKIERVELSNDKEVTKLTLPVDDNKKIS